MALELRTEPVPLRMDEHNTIRVGNTRITLDLLIEAYLNGSSAEDMAAMWDTLDLGDIYAVLGWYLHHKDEVDQYLHKRAEYAQEVRVNIEADPQQASFRQQLQARIQKQQ